MDESVSVEFSSVANMYIFVKETIFFYVNYIKEYGPTTPRELSRYLKFQRPQVEHLVNTACGNDVELKFMRFLALFPSIFRVEDTCSLAGNSGQASSAIFRNIVASRAAALIRNGVSNLIDITRDIKKAVLPVKDYEIISCLNETRVFYITEHYTVDLVEELCINNLNCRDYYFLVDYFLKYFRDSDICVTYEDVVLNTHKFSVHVEDGLFIFCALYSNRRLFSCQEGLVSLRINTDAVLSSMSKISLVRAGRKKSVSEIVKELYGNELFCWNGTICRLSSKFGFIKVLVDLHDGYNHKLFVYFYKDAFEVLFHFEDLQTMICCNDAVTFDAIYESDPKHITMRNSYWRAVSVRFKHKQTFNESKSLGSQIKPVVDNTGSCSEECGISKSCGSTLCDTRACRKELTSDNNSESDDNSICNTAARRKEYGNSKSDSSSLCNTGARSKKQGNSKSQSTKQPELRYLRRGFEKRLCEIMKSYLQIPTISEQLGDVKASSMDQIASSKPVDHYQIGILRCGTSDSPVRSRTDIGEIFESGCETHEVGSESDIENADKFHDKSREGIDLLFSGSKLTIDYVDPSECSFGCETSESSISAVPHKNSYQCHDISTVSFNEDFVMQNKTGISVGDECINDTGLSSDFVHYFGHISLYEDEVDENNSKAKEQARVTNLNICRVGAQGCPNFSSQFDAICCSKLELDDTKLSCICYQAIEHCRPLTSSLLCDCHTDKLQSSKGTTLWINQHSHKNFLFLFAEVGDVCGDFACLFGQYKGRIVLLGCVREVFIPSSSLAITFENLCVGTIVLAFVPYIDEESKTFLPTLVIPVDVGGQRRLWYYESLCPEKYFRKHIYSTLRIEPNLEFHCDSFIDFNLSINRFSQPVPKPLFSALKTLLNRKNSKRQSRIRKDWKHNLKQNYSASHEFWQVAAAEFSSEMESTNGKENILLNNNPGADCFVVESSNKLSTSQLGTSSESSVSPCSYVTCPTSDSDLEDENFSFVSIADDVNYSLSSEGMDDVLPSADVDHVTVHYNCSCEDLTLVSHSSESSNTEKVTSFLQNGGAPVKATGISDFTFTKLDHGNCGSSVIEQTVLVKTHDSTSSSKGISKGEFCNRSRGNMFQNRLSKSKTCFKFKASHYGSNAFKVKHRNRPRSGLAAFKEMKMHNCSHLFAVSDGPCHVLKARVLTITSAGMLVQSKCETFPIVCSFPLMTKDVPLQDFFQREVKMHLALSRMSGIFPHVLCLEIP